MTRNLLAPNDAQRSFTQKREGEVRLGERIKFLERAENLKDLSSRGVKIGLLGIPEDLGVFANGGRSGARDGWEVFLRSFLNRQSNRFLDGTSLAVLGEVSCADLLPKEGTTFSKLREECSVLDVRVEEVVKEIFKGGLTPVVIGGGHNNAYPILKAHGSPLAVLNIDAHADFRLLEGRHSGNSFSYASKDGLLSHYAVFGLHEGYNSEEMLLRLETAGYKFRSFEAVTQGSMRENLEEFRSYLPTEIGLEIDLDSIAFVPTSASTPVGFTVSQVGGIIEWAVKNFSIKYLHLSEGAPKLGYDGDRIVGRTLSYLVSRFISASLKKN